ncbi:uncharacterized protein LOC108256723 isoform X1 [Ictalurus punctatus]|uniref:Uncharacterized protein LOC108256723 isoform X1 n=1 Tax=Ictalurus punctatus TaxID=7998 RepID=A0A2D0PS25_ICTPU|nr:uncharacterized protein LOC108256723 isoform X1 [Ictalurus punctatus]XP_053530908.1 uncharacterized protein LOC108256723 isoform X1 [Ictalurus punctatus]XP_053530909.1 uncharacterized protein LOC108256723 isoform X1 [Ictalurus punctatus]
MMAQCRFDSYHLLIFLLMVSTTECENCDILDSIETVLNSVVTVTCPLTPWPEVTQVIWEVLQGEKAERVGSVTNCSSSCTTEANNNRAQRPLCKVRAVQDLQKGTGSLIISPVEITDAVWYRCTVQNRTRSYCSQVKIGVKDEPQLQTPIQECKSLDPVEVVQNSTLMLQCPVPRSHLGAQQLIWGTVEVDVTVPITRCPSHCTSSGPQKPLCERAKTMENGSLTISHVESTDSQWFWCALAVNSTLCYKFKLTAKDNASPNLIIKAEGDSYATQSPPEQTNSRNGTVASSNATVMITSATSTFLLVAMLVGVYICFRKQKKKSTHKVELENPYEVFEEIVHNDIFQYSSVQFQPASSYTFNK